MGNKPASGFLWGSSYLVDYRRQVGRFKIKFSWRRSDGVMGRFGGGWNWKLGIQIGGSTVHVSLLVCEASVSRIRKELE